MSLALPAGAVTGVGSLPGTDPAVAQPRVFELLPDLPHLVELPARGPGADLVGRGAALLTDLPVDLQPAGWRFVDRPGRDLRRARDLLARDLDALAEAGAGYVGPLKVQACGPWTLAAGVELQRGDKALADPGAVREIGASLADGLAAHVDVVRRAVPGAEVTVQLDEPSLPAVLAGRVRSASGFATLRTPEPTEVTDVLATVLCALPHPGVHCCAPGVPVDLVRRAGARWVSLDTTLRQDEDQVGAAYEAGATLLLGVAGADPAPARDLVRRLGIASAVALGQTVLTPSCGLATVGEEQAWSTCRRLAEGGRRLAEQIEELR